MRTLLGFLMVVPLLARGDLPTSYDLRSVDVGGSTVSWISDIQDQGVFSDCWSFASAEAINSNLLMNNMLGAPAVTPPPIQVSSWHLSTANGAPESVIGPNYGPNSNTEWGGFEYQAMGYVTRGQGSWNIPGVPSPTSDYITQMGGGVVLNSQNPLNNFPASLESTYPANLTNPNVIPPAEQTVAFQTRTVTFLQQGFSTNVALPTPTSGDHYNFDLGAADPQVQAVKNAITASGAVTTTMKADYNYFSYSATTNAQGNYTVTYINPGDTQNTGNSAHEVTIIGWDDTHVITDPTTGATTTGAWLVQNSWGTTNWTNPNVADKNDGTFWASYNDPIIGRVGVASFTMGSTAGYSQKVIQNEVGPLSYASNYVAANNPLGMAQDSHKTVASILTPTDAGVLTALGLASQAATTVHITIYGGWANGPTGTALLTQDFTFNSIGYQLVDLSQTVDLLSGQPIVIELTYGVTGAAPIVIGGDDVNGYLTVTDGLSYYLGDGGVWGDLADMVYEGYSGTADSDGGILFLKGYTAVPEPTTVGLVALGCVAAFWRRRSLRP